MTHRIWLSAVTGCGLLSMVVTAVAAEQTEVERGEYLAHAGDCVACHTASDDKPFAGGLEIESPLGTIVSSNITPDPDAGIGDYTRDEFAAALREGKRADGANLYPAMPYPSYAKISNEDIDALYAYFMQEVEPVADKPPKSDVSFPFNSAGVSVCGTGFSPMQRHSNRPTSRQSRSSVVPTWSRDSGIAVAVIRHAV